MRESPIYQEILKEGIEKGKVEALQQIAINLINTGMVLEDISRVTGLSVEKLRVLQKETNNLFNKTSLPTSKPF
ncbi:MAG: hypothetical protein AAF915_00175 [Cyanobacteria bacterium P01_D01_bin.50]